MNASSLLMVIRSRTFGMLCSVTGSAVSSAAAIAGSAEFFAPLIATVPRSAFPPLIKNLSMPFRCRHLSSLLRRSSLYCFSFASFLPFLFSSLLFVTSLFSVSLCLCDLCVNSFFSFPHRLSHLSPHRLQFLPRLRRPHSPLQHHHRHSHVVSRRPQSVFRGRHLLPARLRQDPQRPVRQLLICQHHVDHQVLIHMPQPRHHRRTQHVQHHLLRRSCLQPRRPRQHFRPHLRRNHDFRQTCRRHPSVARNRYRQRPSPTRKLHRRQHVQRRPARRYSDHYVVARQFYFAQFTLCISNGIFCPFHCARHRASSPRDQCLHLFW